MEAVETTKLLGRHNLELIRFKRKSSIGPIGLEERSEIEMRRASGSCERSLLPKFIREKMSEMTDKSRPLRVKPSLIKLQNKFLVLEEGQSGQAVTEQGDYLSQLRNMRPFNKIQKKDCSSFSICLKQHIASPTSNSQTKRLECMYKGPTVPSFNQMKAKSVQKLGSILDMKVDDHSSERVSHKIERNSKPGSASDLDSSKIFCETNSNDFSARFKETFQIPRSPDSPLRPILKNKVQLKPRKAFKTSLATEIPSRFSLADKKVSFSRYMIYCRQIVEKNEL